MHSRPNERSALKRKLLAGCSINMPAPRRVGKTWLLARLADDLRADGWLVVEIDVEGLGTTTEFAQELRRRIEASCPPKVGVIASLRTRVAQVVGGTWDGGFGEALGRLDPIEFTEMLIASIAESHDKAVILIDEIAYFVLACVAADRQATHDLLYRLRALRQRYPKVRWVFTGSIGLDDVARRHGLEGALVDLDLFALASFTKAEALSFVRDPALVARFTHPFAASDDDLDWMFDELGWLSPFYLYLVANEVRPSMTSPDGRLPIAARSDLEAAFGVLLRPNRQSSFAVFREHIDKNLPAGDREVALAVLATLSRAPDGETEATLLAAAATRRPGITERGLRDVLLVLENDAIIVRRGDRFAFRSGLVRRYWQEYVAE